MDKLEEKAIERVEELLKDAIFDECVVVSDAERCYMEGYKDAQKETIDKVCEWLNNNLRSYGAHYYFVDQNKLNKDLRKAMEDKEL